MTNLGSSLALTRYGERSLTRYGQQAREIANVSHEAFQAARAITRLSRNQILEQLCWTDQKLFRLQQQGRLTPALEEAILYEFDSYMRQIGWITGQAYTKLRRALAKQPEARSLSRLDVAIDAYFLLAGGGE